MLQIWSLPEWATEFILITEAAGKTYQAARPLFPALK
jgi:hypothetical protein